MNQKQRKQISQLISTLSGVDPMVYAEASATLESVKDDVEALRDEEQDKYDNMPEALQGSDRGDTMQAGIDALEAALGSLEEAIEALTEVNEDNQPAEDDSDEDEAEEAQAAIDQASDYLSEVA